MESLSQKGQVFCFHVFFLVLAFCMVSILCAHRWAWGNDSTCVEVKSKGDQGIGVRRSMGRWRCQSSIYHVDSGSWIQVVGLAGIVFTCCALIWLHNRLCQIYFCSAFVSWEYWLLLTWAPFTFSICAGSSSVSQVPSRWATCYYEARDCLLWWKFTRTVS